MAKGVKEVDKSLVWQACIITLFPEVFPGTLGVSLTGKALAAGAWACQTVNMRDFAIDKHGTVDDTPFGGGAGMLIRPDVVHQAMEKAKQWAPKNRRIYLSPRGRLLDQPMVESLAKGPGVTVLCGRYEGVDQRVLDAWEMEEVSIGDYVLCGGEAAALALLEACVRWLPGVVGEAASLNGDSLQNHLLEHNHYTRPQVWHGQKVPDVLLSGHHANIRAWRLAESERVTQHRRPDLWEKWVKSKKI